MTRRTAERGVWLIERKWGRERVGDGPNALADPELLGGATDCENLRRQRARWSAFRQGQRVEATSRSLHPRRPETIPREAKEEATMSHSCDETYSVYDEQSRRARKLHRCSACKETIRPGDRYFSIHVVHDGATTIKRCLRCQKMHEHLRCLGDGDTWPDERLNCGESYENEWGECPLDIQRLAFLTPDEAQKELR